MSSTPPPPPQSAYVGRIAPSPTGHLHPGHASTFITACRRAAERRGKVLLRIEDLDQARCKQHLYGEMIEDMQWMREIKWDTDAEAEGKLCMQSERISLYEKAWLTLYKKKMIYPCPRSRKDVERALSAPHEGDSEVIFPESLRPNLADICVDESVTKPSKGINWRFRVDDGRQVTFNDNCQGQQSFTAGEDFGDFVVYTKDGYASYELAVVTDDAAMGITEVVRGADLLLSTARQILLYEALFDNTRSKIPEFYHCPLVRDAEGKRMAKRNGDTTLRALREAGKTPDDILTEFCEPMKS